jgi:hypothetical protein
MVHREPYGFEPSSPSNPFINVFDVLESETGDFTVSALLAMEEDQLGVTIIRGGDHFDVGSTPQQDTPTCQQATNMYGPNTGETGHDVEDSNGRQ